MPYPHIIQANVKIKNLPRVLYLVTELQFLNYFLIFQKMHICVCLCICLGLQRVYHPRDEPAAGAVAHAARFSPRDRAHGGHHPPQVQCHSDTAQAEHLRGRHDPALTLPRRQVSVCVCVCVCVCVFLTVCVFV